jgi:hypothetical protein
MTGGIYYLPPPILRGFLCYGDSAGGGDGHITLDVPITVEGKHETRNIHGKLNGGGGLLNIHTGDSSIRLGKS